MSTYPRTYDLIHADSVFSLYKERYGIIRSSLMLSTVLD